MATPKKLPSGNWRVRVYSHTENNKKIYVSFTAHTKTEANRLASEYQCNKDMLTSSDMTLEQAMRKYIQVKENILSPSTINEYKRGLKNYAPISKIRISQLDTSTLQSFVNDISKTHSPKTVRNIYSFLISSIKMFSDRNFHITLPQKKPIERNIPDDNDIQNLINNASDELKMAIVLASEGTLRRGEICGLKYKDILRDFNAVYVHSDVVKGSNGWFYKEMPKNGSSVRRVVLPKEVIELLGNGDGDEFIYKHPPNVLTQQFIKLRDKLGLECRFHDLRHYAASILHAIGVPDQYIMERGGWSSDSTLKSIYRNSLNDKSAHFTSIANEYFKNNINMTQNMTRKKLNT